MGRRGVIARRRDTASPDRRAGTKISNHSAPGGLRRRGATATLAGVTEPVLRRKLIEVALPLDAINEAAAREKSIRHGHPSTLHLWWARRPLAAARAVLFAQMVDDPSARPELFPTKEKQDEERERLFAILRELVLWENTTNEKVLEAARAEIRKSWRRTCEDHTDHPRAAELFDPEKLPAFHDPFAGGGALPLEAQRLGLEAHASDLNPVAVLINKAMIEIPSRFAGQPPVNPEAQAHELFPDLQWRGASGLAKDVRHYGELLRGEAEDRIGHLYPRAWIGPNLVKKRPDLERYRLRDLTVIAWLWARTVRSPNPAFAHVEVPLVSTFMLSTKKGKEAYVEPVVEGDSYRFEVRVGVPKDLAAAMAGTKLARGSFRCLLSNTPVKYAYIDDEANAGRMGARLMAVVAEGDRERVYLPPTTEMEEAAREAAPTWKPDLPSRGTWASNAQGRRYGFKTFGDYFTPRQLVALTTFSDLVGEAMDQARSDAVTAGLPDDNQPLREGGTGATAYAEAVGVYLAFTLSKQADLGNSLCAWEPVAQCPRHLFGRQGIPMVWDFAESNPVGSSSGAWGILVDGIVKAFSKAFESVSEHESGCCKQADAATQNLSRNKIVSSDPPYYDNIGYADLSDFFYVWLRRSLKSVFPDLFATLATPKSDELVATPYRHGGKDAAEQFFVRGMKHALSNLAEQTHPSCPVTIYYAFKQSETKGDAGTVRTGWETFLEAVIHSGFAITSTWPMRTENRSRMVGQATNALASSIVLACRKRPAPATTTRRKFSAALRSELPGAVARLQAGNIAPVDLAQAAIGPGMAIFTRHSRVLEADDTAMTVRLALALISAELDEILSASDADYDPWTRFAITWFETRGMEPGPYGDAETLATARGVSVRGVVDAGILEAKGGQARLLRRNELDPDWQPDTDQRFTVWECAQHTAHRLFEGGGELAAAELLVRAGDRSGNARDLAYRLYRICEQTKRADEALIWNDLINLWPSLLDLAPQATTPRPRTLYGKLGTDSDR